MKIKFILLLLLAPYLHAEKSKLPPPSVLDLQVNDEGKVVDLSSSNIDVTVNRKNAVVNEREILLTGEQGIKIHFDQTQEIFQKTPLTWVIKVKGMFSAALSQPLGFVLAGRWNVKSGRQIGIGYESTSRGSIMQLLISPDGEALNCISIKTKTSLPNNEWFQIAATYNPTDKKISIYRYDANGELIERGEQKFIAPYFEQGNSDFVLGAPRDLVITVSRFRAWSKVLEDSEINGATSDTE